MVLLEELNEQLAKVKNQQHKRKKWQNQIADYKAELKEKQETAAELKSKIEKDKDYIEKLEHISFTHLMAFLTGSTDERIWRKQNEIATTKLKYDESQHALTHIENSIKEIQEKINNLPDIDREYQHILKSKEQFMENAHSPLTMRYNELSEKVADLKSFLTETSEAIGAGEMVKSSLTDAIHIIEKAKNWGAFDMFGGGWIATQVKYKHIDDAKASIHNAQNKMRVFHKELLDVQEEADWNIKISGLLTFADFFFDGIFIDYIVQEKIEDALEKTQEQQNEIDKIILHLNFRYDLKEKELNQLQSDKKALIEGFGT